MNKHAYLIMVHNRLDSLKKLLLQLDSKNHDFYVHFDKKISKEDFDSFTVDLKFSKMYKFREFSVFWAHISQTECQLFLLKKAVSNIYSYYHLLSGSDFPLKSNDELFKFFNNSGKEFVHFESEVVSDYKKRFIDRYYLFQKYNRHVPFLDFLENVSLKIQKIFGIDRCRNGKYSTGANWFSITHELAVYIVENTGAILKRYKYTRSSDEFYLQSLIINSKFVSNLYSQEFNNDIKSNQRLVDWKRGNPYVFTRDDIDEILSSDVCFVRKVNLDDGLTDLLVDRINGGVK